MMTAAVFTLIGVILGTVLNFLLQRDQDNRRWRREDELKFEPERLSLYRDFLNEMERTRALERFDRDRLWRLLSEMELLGSREVFQRAYGAYECGEGFWKFAHSDDAPTTVTASDGTEFPFDVDDYRGQLESMLYRFIRVVRKELGVTTDFKPTKVTMKGKIIGVPEDVRELKEMEKKRPRWKGVFGG